MVYFWFFMVMMAIVVFAASTLAAFVSFPYTIPALASVAFGWFAACKADEQAF